MNKKELREWMNYYRDEHIKDHNILVEIKGLVGTSEKIKEDNKDQATL